MQAWFMLHKMMIVGPAMTSWQVPRLTLMALLVSVLALTGCGQKGDLYRPERDPSAQPTSK